MVTERALLSDLEIPPQQHGSTHAPWGIEVQFGQQFALKPGAP
jgi:hypothetical protein